MPAKTKLPLLQWSLEPSADELISSDPNALLIGFCLDQQITVEQAFTGPLRIRDRLGTIDPRQLATTDPTKMEAAFRERPAIHRFPASMAQRVQKLCAALASEYGGDASRVWDEAKDGADLYKRLNSLPGIGEMKARTLVRMTGKYWRPELPGWEEAGPKWPTLADVVTTEERVEYQTKKRAHKAELRAQGKLPARPARRSPA